jgi:hypothetical protein
MNFKNKLNQIKALLSMEVKMEEMILEDGVTKIEAEVFEAGYSVGITTEEGIVPLPVGEYITQDGKVLKVEQEGVILSIEDVEETPEEVEEVEEVEMTENPKKVVETISKETFFAELEKFEAKFNEMKEGYEAKLADMELKLSEQPSVPAIVYNPEIDVKQLTGLSTKKRTNHIVDRVSAILNK